jgi:hypothetical protein
VALGTSLVPRDSFLDLDGDSALHDAPSTAPKAGSFNAPIKVSSRVSTRLREQSQGPIVLLRVAPAANLTTVGGVKRICPKVLCPWRRKEIGNGIKWRH